jgi:hypothetical protein
MTQDSQISQDGKRREWEENQRPQCRSIQEAAPGLLHSSTHLWRSLMTSILRKYPQRCVSIVSMTNESRISPTGPTVSCQASDDSKQLSLKVAKHHKALLHVPHIRCICSCDILKVLVSVELAAHPKSSVNLCDILWRQQVIAADNKI